MHINKLTILPEKFPNPGKYPFNMEIFRKTRMLDLASPVTFFVGENGTGKSTLLQAITRRCHIYIWRGESRARYDYSPYEDKLYRGIEVEWAAGTVPGSFFASEIFKNFAKILDEWASMDPKLLEYFGGKSLMAQSHGQSLMSFFKSRFKIKGVYFLDEPETALSPRSQIDLLKLITEMSRAGHAQFIIATHSPILMACPQAVIYSFDEIPIQPIAYEDSEHYQVLRSFLMDRTQYIQDI